MRGTPGDAAERQEKAAGAAPAGRRLLGRGRSGEVWLSEDPAEGWIATKIFYGDTLSNLVHYVLTGAPNPYIWNEDAVRCAYERRKILHALVPFWLGGRLEVADATHVRWNEAARAWELGTRFVPGAPVPLLHPFRPEDGRLEWLLREVMHPLQERLEESGFLGAVWQAGRGNPVALNNYLLLPDERFVFIDAESGVPALFPMNPLALLGFYLPQSLRLGRALFDDVDTERLCRYLEAEAPALERALGAAALETLRRRAGRLAHHQRRWKGLRRAERGILYQLAKGRLTPAQAEHYRRHPLRWRLREARRAAVKAARRAAALPGAAARLFARLDLPGRLRQLRRFVASQEYRTEIGRGYVEGRIARWEERGQITGAEAARLRADLARTEESSSYITDFGAHLGLKASFLTVELLLLGILALLGVPLVILALIVLLDGPIYRSLYTAWRALQAARARQPLPWVAFLVGLVPEFGSMAFPAQMVWSARGERDDVARFILCDSFTRLGNKLPIWGGADTLVEHRLNRLGMAMAGASERWRRRRAARHGPAAPRPGDGA
ncbi:hypothetical protein [Crenalkalicoccus roseus]|uniref:hypothetical protein n=1 Tax=Crenalkalicoccus roseus TaxID=1485588 RepID=UPI001081B662|nr:hypothetical protein [Crenalkalicoccus roseus]